jgi:hypothetical protein
MTRPLSVIVAAFASLFPVAVVTQATPATIVLTLEGLQDNEPTGSYYNSDHGGFGSGPGPAYGFMLGLDSCSEVRRSPTLALTARELRRHRYPWQLRHLLRELRSAPTVCPWSPVGVTLGGTAECVDRDVICGTGKHDNITLGSSGPGVTPEPGTIILFGSGLLALGAAFRRRKETIATA